MKERELDRYFVAKLRRFECITIKLTTFGKYGTAGWPDRLIISKYGNPKYFFIELKTEVGKLTAVQEQKQNQLRYLGCYVRTLYGKEEVDEWLLWLNNFLNGAVTDHLTMGD